MSIKEPNITIVITFFIFFTQTHNIFVKVTKCSCEKMTRRRLICAVNVANEHIGFLRSDLGNRLEFVEIGVIDGMNLVISIIIHYLSISSKKVELIFLQR